MRKVGMLEKTLILFWFTSIVRFYTEHSRKPGYSEIEAEIMDSDNKFLIPEPELIFTSAPD
jgi:hypothetical protein